ncbi:chemotaxis protein CheX [Desulfovibrio ferrophilus]|uniref:Putative chemotaxis phosphatase, CheX n=1 Tax=Desulfovibrio ferrophilus TaxID=241368 RepID=A0A2Z6AVH1_9BACT|nr:chemotaxis protein CheX [Desulfovibrio ferrophilus]BBD07231.1 putative chemotaxis phosphatase, CheX [Desulfovibrio ferrophilus]
MNVKEDAKIVRPFLDAVQNVISTMAMIEVTPGKPFVKKDTTAHGDVTGVISMSGDRDGTISVTFTRDCALSVVSNMLGEKLTEMDGDIRDAVGELTNMISGQARRGLQQDGLTMEAGIPTVVMGQNHSISHMTKDPILAIPFSTPGGTFTVEVSLE